MQPTSTDSTDYLFLDLLDKYVRQVADHCDLPQLAAPKTLLNQVDLSPLSPLDQSTFDDWLSKRFYLRISIENALRRGLLVTVNRAGHVESNRTEYAVRIEGQ